MRTDNWSIEKVINLISDHVEESTHLEYKAAKAIEDKESISIDVSSFANAGGGVIIYGIKESKENKHLPERIDPIVRKDFSKETLEQIINSNIFPKAIVQIEPLEIDDLHVVYVVTVPQGETAHQASDFRYYRRYNFQKLPMQDYEIRDIMNRVRHPKIRLHLEIDEITHTSIHNRVITGVGLKIFLENEGTVLANYVNYDLVIPSALLLEPDGYRQKIIQGIHMLEISGQNMVRDLLDVVNTTQGQEAKFGPGRYHPILPKRSFFERSFPIVTHQLQLLRRQKVPISWTVYTDNAAPVTKNLTLADIEHKHM
ncbi:putative DNA binding domain-containing protein [Fulvivirgaceae bacterium PWU4]|uniref:DNA binding domain-containing protein n=1 Tax=Chryseosolibacter histidini TaxID=2782349 RepID=A0AAP2DL65_9BACT|nr:ATP-binding protein [Chryseosolibacter histidini]MBT1698261.1 putative DNA binding domain-containing protein [Chryseosolibacter histidini]